ncbi:hypothetical protein EJ06DRAFT_553787 [Trichodelitschia bisporula]|uniref:Uncharacterized protein n=1 Tax=Trichodelitschia bisporula TaxID=703511 RepID=A0A6G1I5A7_9PEZI|nr:hypothetical protein EJ06DRAFT_553787 [Trichodelitschia bisporula]
MFRNALSAAAPARTSPALAACRAVHTKSPKSVAVKDDAKVSNSQPLGAFKCTIPQEVTPDDAQKFVMGDCATENFIGIKQEGVEDFPEGKIRTMTELVPENVEEVVKAAKKGVDNTNDKIYPGEIVRHPSFYYP